MTRHDTEPPDKPEVPEATVERITGYHEDYPNHSWVTYRVTYKGHLLGGAYSEQEARSWIEDMRSMEAAGDYDPSLHQTAPRTVRATAEVISFREADAEVEAFRLDNTRVIRDGTARSIASWWRSSASAGLACLAAGLPVAYDVLVKDAEAVLKERGLIKDSSDEMAALMAWADAKVGPA